MKYNNISNRIFDYLETIADVMNDPMTITDKLKKSELFNFPNNFDLKNSINKNIYVEPENSNIENNESVPSGDNKSLEVSKSYNDNKSSGYYNNKQNTSSEPQGVIDSITQEITSARLQQAIILSEIVGKPRSKTRKKRRF